MSIKCEQCSTENEYSAELCIKCGLPIPVEVGKKLSNKQISYLSGFISKAMSFIVGMFAFTIIKVVFSFCLIALVNQNVITVDTYESYGFLFILISIYLAVKSIKALNEIEQTKTRVILRIVIIIIGLISGVLLGINNSLAQTSNRTVIQMQDNHFNDQSY